MLLLLGEYTGGILNYLQAQPVATPSSAGGALRSLTPPAGTAVLLGKQGHPFPLPSTLFSNFPFKKKSQPWLA